MAIETERIRALATDRIELARRKFGFRRRDEGRFVAPGTTLLLAREGDGYTVRLDGEGAEKAKALSADGLRALRIQKRNGWVEAYGGPALNEEAAAPREAAQTASNLNW